MLRPNPYEGSRPKFYHPLHSPSLNACSRSGDVRFVGIPLLGRRCRREDRLTIRYKCSESPRQPSVLNFRCADPLIDIETSWAVWMARLSQLSAIIGSTFEARRARIAQANPDTKPRRIFLDRLHQSETLCLHFPSCHSTTDLSSALVSSVSNRAPTV